jgi:hypothetical protein
MAKITRLSAEQRENLTAYLDGELDEAQTQEIEQVLATSEVARHEVDMLSRTWDALSVLPTHKASGEFTRKTMTNLRAAESSEPGAASQMIFRNARRGVVLAAWAGVLGVCAYLAFMATNHWIPNDSEQLLEDYELISNLDRYQEVLNYGEGDTTAFLQILRDKRTFADHDTHSEK